MLWRPAAPTSVREFCTLAFDYVGLNMDDHVVVEQRYLRPAEVDFLQGNSAKVRERLGWKPEATLRGTSRRNGRGRSCAGETRSAPLRARWMK